MRGLDHSSKQNGRRAKGRKPLFPVPRDSATALMAKASFRIMSEWQSRAKVVKFEMQKMKFVDYFGTKSKLREEQYKVNVPLY